jgi:hypothetical protein
LVSKLWALASSWSLPLCWMQDPRSLVIWFVIWLWCWCILGFSHHLWCIVIVWYCIIRCNVLSLSIYVYSSYICIYRYTCICWVCLLHFVVI